MVVVYSKANCPQCDLTKRDMNILGIKYREVDVQEGDVASELRAKGYRMAPVVETSTGAWSGYNQAKIKALVK